MIKRQKYSYSCEIQYLDKGNEYENQIDAFENGSIYANSVTINGGEQAFHCHEIKYKNETNGRLIFTALRLPPI